MSDKIGPVTFTQGEPHPFLGREIARHRDFSEATARIVDEEVQAIVQKGEEQALQILGSHRKELDKLADALLEKETLSAEEVDQLLGRKAHESS